MKKDVTVDEKKTDDTQMKKTQPILTHLEHVSERTVDTLTIIKKPTEQSTKDHRNEQKASENYFSDKKESKNTIESQMIPMSNPTNQPVSNGAIASTVQIVLNENDTKKSINHPVSVQVANEKKNGKKVTGNQKNQMKQQDVQKKPIIEIVASEKKEKTNERMFDKILETSNNLDQIKTANIKNILGL